VALSLGCKVIGIDVDDTMATFVQIDPLLRRMKEIGQKYDKTNVQVSRGVMQAYSPHSLEILESSDILDCK
jgi:hypothetical protein